MYYYKSLVYSRSTTYTFNPKPANPSFLSHSLVELLSQISPAFKKNFTALQKKRYRRVCFGFTDHVELTNIDTSPSNGASSVH